MALSRRPLPHAEWAQGGIFYLPHICAAMEVMLHYPEFELLDEPYLGPMR